MAEEYKIFEPHIPERLMKFFQKHNESISLFFSILKQVKPHIPDTYTYSEDYPPPHPRYKYTDKLYIGCIFYITKYNSSWESFIGPIPGKQVHKQHMEYLKHDIYSKFFNESLTQYLNANEKRHKNNVKYISIDSTTINNKLCEELDKHNPCNKNRKGIKISSIVDSNGTTLVSSVNDSSKHDSKFVEENLEQLIKNKLINNAIKRAKNKTIFLADSAYDTIKIRELLEKMNIRCIIMPNNRGTKDPAKLRSLTKTEEEKYENRLKSEHNFAIMKKFPKINCIYERTQQSYFCLVLLTSGIINHNRAIKIAKR